MEILRIEEEYIYNGLGFPYTLYSVPIVKDRDYEYEEINIKEVGEKAFLDLIRHNGRYSWSMLKFIRKHMKYSQDKMSELLKCSKATISNKEKNENKNEAASLNPKTIMRMKTSMKKYHMSQISSELDESIIESTAETESIVIESKKTA